MGCRGRRVGGEWVNSYEKKNNVTAETRKGQGSW